MVENECPNPRHFGYSSDLIRACIPVGESLFDHRRIRRKRGRPKEGFEVAISVVGLVNQYVSAPGQPYQVPKLPRFRLGPGRSDRDL